MKTRKNFNKLLNEDSNFYINWNVPYSNDEETPYTIQEQKKMMDTNFKKWKSQ